jgi:beta-galactosidase
MCLLSLPHRPLPPSIGSGLFSARGWQLVTLLLALVLSCACGCSSTFKAGRESRSPRHELDLNRGWKFCAGDVAAGAGESVDDAAWAAVDLPHTWNAFDGQDGGGDYHRGPAWYRRRLAVPAAWKGKSLFLRFGAAATVADVYVNGRRAGSHRGNFAAFCFDVTDLLRAGDGNLIAVRVDNSKVDDIAPLSGDFTIFGGLYRDARLLVLDPLHVSPVDDASSGVYLEQDRVTASSADVVVTTKLRSARAQSAPAIVTCVIRDASGTVVRSATVDQEVGAHSSADAIARLTIDRPHLWNGRRDPYLYTATVSVHDAAGREVDRVTQPLGIRQFDIDPDRGLILNGSPYRLYGVSRHQDRQDKGWAVSDADHDEDFRLITDMGCTGVRLAHYQHADHVYDLCDRLGLVSWAEAALVNDITHTPAFADNAKQQLRELIKQNYNHPSIFFWSLYNELALAKPDFADEQKLVTELNDLAHALDPRRMTVAATHKQKVDHPVNWIPDATAFNRYVGWYQDQPSDWPRVLDELRAALPGKRIGISEYGAGASIFQHEANPTKPRTGGAWHPEEWQNAVHEAAWRSIKDRPWLWCTFVWNMFDFAADERSEGDRLGINDKGLVTFDRQTRKDAFYFYQANWRADEPVLHITSRRFNPRPSGPIEVKAYSNCDEVELSLAGRSLGTKQPIDGVVTWANVLLREGDNEVRAVGKKNAEQVTDAVAWRASRIAATRIGTTQPATR